MTLIEITDDPTRRVRSDRRDRREKQLFPLSALSPSRALRDPIAFESCITYSSHIA